MEKSKCIKCLHQWISRIEQPLQCPKCKSYNWNKTKSKEDKK